ncbi:hypothetical protein L1987_46192 [Smallanthus sonchifolius]|uniref:Uncharacterized protein n=1 Tax=Smallanthus sonchifolius TaxID=185202 RepID=A0ACB9G033_9ASTR|nr:hypothetical protein L1987_46192 [Smallanthus sonchifolius]
MADTIPTGQVGCFNMKARYKAGKSSFNILNDIDRLMSEKSNIEWTDEPKPLGKVSSTKVSTSTVVHEDDDGTQRRLKYALKSLESDDNKTRIMALSVLALDNLPGLVVCQWNGVATAGGVKASFTSEHY